MKKHTAVCMKSVSAIALMATGLIAPSVAAQDEYSLEEIVVTATKRASSIQDVPFSINAQSQADIQRSGAKNIEDLSRNIAGLTIQNLGPGQSQVSIRGVSAGQIVRDQPGVKEQVGVYLDESVISLSLFTPDLDFYDLNRVETLRGPQGTLFGSGSIGGTIRYITNQPNVEEFEGSAEIDLNQIDGGGFGGSAKGMINVPFGDGLGAFRAVAYHTEYGGYIDAIREGGTIDENVNSGNRTGGRLAFTFKPSDTVTITPRIIYQEIDTDGFNRQEVFNLYANPFTDASAEGGRAPVTFEERQQFLLLDEGFKDETLIADLNIEVGFDGFDVTAISSYTDRDILVSRDASALTGSVSVDLGFPDEAVLLPSNLRDSTKVEQFTQELRFSSNGDGPFQWIIGGFYSNTDRFYQQFLPTPGYDAFTDQVLGAGTAEATRAGVGPADSPFFSELPYTLEQIAVFGEVSYDVTDRLNITVGGRYYDYDEEREIDQVGLFGSGTVDQVDSTSSNGFTPRFLLSYDLTEEVTLNAQASKGFRLGGVNDPLNTPLCNPEDLDTFGSFQNYDDETLWNYEVGVKVNTGNISFNAAAFYNDISNLQVTLDAGSCSSRITFNVEEAHTLGVEAEFKARLFDGFDVSFAGSVLEAEFDSTVTSAGAVLGGVREGNRLASTPEYNFGTTASYTFPFEIAGDGVEAYVAGTFSVRGSIFTQPSDQEASGDFVSNLAFGGASGTDVTSVDLELDSYKTANLSFGIFKDEWEFVLYVNNIFDENANLSFDRERGGRARLGFRTNQPRTFGAVYRINF
ncbi:TonB-dependent receptor [Kordiimonas sp. SCSIO 12603]|uniref:TonB-dependent receptor n=1 Tax=Kordiimonas sp. SCSIO 12603 TaxID=2829596 RepID=UPI0021033D2B|nr:TonB-dependent receptor [Kordiimonas sp. SCSIO 12603]